LKLEMSPAPYMRKDGHENADVGHPVVSGLLQLASINISQ